MRVAPGGPFDKEKPLAPAVVANLKRNFGLARDVPTTCTGVLQKFVVQTGQTIEQGRF